MQQEVNLYQIGQKERKISWMGISFLVLLLLQCGVFAGISLYTQSRSQEWDRKLQAMQKQENNLQKQVEELEKKKKVSDRDYKELRENIQELGNKWKARRRLLEVFSSSGSTQQQGFAPFLQVLARQNISNLWLTGFEIDLQGKPSLRLRGKAKDSERIPEYLMRLSKEEIFSGYKFEKLSAERRDNSTGAIAFTLKTKSK